MSLVLCDRAAMGEECIRIKLRNCRIGIAIMADIRPLNHLALIPVLLPAAVLSLFTSTYQRDILRRARAGSVFSEHFFANFCITAAKSM